MKNFYACNTFFKHIIYIYTIALVMKESGQKNIDDFQAWIAQSDWPSAIKQAKKPYLSPYYIPNIRANAKIKTDIEVIATLSNRKDKWLGFVEE